MTALDDALMGLRQMIASGELQPGAKFPPEPRLCEQLHVSRGSLREAVRMLGALGVVESRHGSGVYVSDLSASKLIGSLSLTIGLLPIDGILDLIEIRRVLEGYAAGQAAIRAQDDDRERLQQMVDELASEQDSLAASRLDSVFHDFIAALAGNEPLREFVKLLRIRNRAFYTLFDIPCEDDMRVVSERGHQQIAAAIIAGDQFAASNAASNHVMVTHEWLRRYRPTIHTTDLDGELVTDANPVTDCAATAVAELEPVTTPTMES